ncbi:hypothetical protein AB7M42_003801 [Bradyrhizobium diazoefficiens]|jgi:hypothetical protein|nr:hypothetical protein [Bradyrhizobium japonicum]MBP1093817.1 hypothetical protein [Bradyrhizobium japonicum]
MICVSRAGESTISLARLMSFLLIKLLFANIGLVLQC